jgi:hypothetical protein
MRAKVLLSALLGSTVLAAGPQPRAQSTWMTRGARSTAGRSAVRRVATRPTRSAWPRCAASSALASKVAAPAARRASSDDSETERIERRAHRRRVADAKAHPGRSCDRGSRPVHGVPRQRSQARLDELRGVNAISPQPRGARHNGGRRVAAQSLAMGVAERMGFEPMIHLESV